MHLKTTTPSIRLHLLKNLEIFALPLAELSVLAELCSDVCYQKNQHIVYTGELIDSIFIVVTGKVEITNDNGSLGTLSAGGSFVLGNQNFVSASGFFTADIRAIQTTLVLRIPLTTLFLFMQKHIGDSKLLQRMALFIKLQFIKNIELFSQANLEEIHSIIEQTKELKMHANTIVFNQGDDADFCYLIYSGSVHVIQKNSQGNERYIAKLEEGDMFGETALITDCKRNATIRTCSDCKFITLEKTQLLQLLKCTPDAIDKINKILLERDRPLARSDIAIHSKMDEGNKVSIILENDCDGTYFKTSERGLFIWSFLDSEHTIQDIDTAYFKQYQEHAKDKILNFIDRLRNADYVYPIKLPQDFIAYKIPKHFLVLENISKILKYEYAIKNVDMYITHIYNKIAYVFFYKITLFAMSIIIFPGLYFFFTLLPQVEKTLIATSHAWLLIVLSTLASMISVPLHELAHAFTTKYYGYKVRRFGVGWFWFGPVAFTDTSDMWLSTQKSRIIVNLAGIYINLVIGSLLVIISLSTSDPFIQTLIWLTAMFNYTMAFYNLNPMFELDGYYLLMDAFNKSNLRSKSIWWLMHESLSIMQPNMIKKYKAELCYWWCSLGFIFLSSYIGYLIQVHIFNHLFPPTIASHRIDEFSWVLAFIIMLISFANLYYRIRQEVKYN